MRLAWVLPLFALLTTCLPAYAQGAQSPQPTAATLQDTAQLIGVLSELNRLQALSNNATETNRWQVLWLHQRISEQVMAASLQVDATIAQIDNEIARAGEIRSYLADRRDRAVNRANLLSVVIGGGVGATSSGLQLSRGLSQPGAALGIAAGTLSASLAVAGIRAQKGSSTHFDFQSNMLAEFFDRPILSDSQYPKTIWTFLNQAPSYSSAGPTRKEQLSKPGSRSNALIRSTAPIKFAVLPVSLPSCSSSA
jgi:hypothetical protein